MAFDSDSSSTNSDSTETSAPSDGGESWIQSVVGNFGGSESASSNTDAAASTDDSNPYAPYNSTCPSESLTRDANDISDLEKEYIQKDKK